MVVTSETEEAILDLLKNNTSMSVNDIFRELSQEKGYSERIVKETILKLREEGKIKPNQQWKMELSSI
jgi:predicted transcriptional regulator